MPPRFIGFLMHTGVTDARLQGACAAGVVAGLCEAGAVEARMIQRFIGVHRRTGVTDTRLQFRVAEG